MAHTLAADEVMRFRIFSTMETQVAVNIRHYLVTATTGTGVTDLDTTAFMDQRLAPLMKSLMTAQAQYRGVGGQVIFPTPPFVEQFSQGFTGAGSIAGDAQAPQVCGLIKFTTAFGGRAGRGFIYPPFPAETDCDLTGVTTLGYRTALTALKDSLIVPVTIGAAGNTATLVPILWSGSLATARLINGGVIRNYWSQQKRRSFLRKGDVLPTP